MWAKRRREDEDDEPRKGTSAVKYYVRSTALLHPVLLNLGGDRLRAWSEAFGTRLKTGGG